MQCSICKQVKGWLVHHKTKWLRTQRLHVSIKKCHPYLFSTMMMLSTAVSEHNFSLSLLPKQLHNFLLMQSCSMTNDHTSVHIVFYFNRTSDLLALAMSILLRTKIFGLLLTIWLNRGLRPEKGIWKGLSVLEHFELFYAAHALVMYTQAADYEKILWHHEFPAHNHSPAGVCSWFSILQVKKRAVAQ